MEGLGWGSNMDRREFLKGLVAIGAATALPLSAEVALQGEFGEVIRFRAAEHEEVRRLLIERASQWRPVEGYYSGGTYRT